MPEEYMALVAALKNLRQAGELLPMAEDEWATRPDVVSYGVVQLDFEGGSLFGNDRKVDTEYECSVDLFSQDRHGAGWVQRITETLTEHCGGCWSLNSHQYERETGLFHWEWTFSVED